MFQFCWEIFSEILLFNFKQKRLIIFYIEFTFIVITNKCNFNMFQREIIVNPPTNLSGILKKTALMSTGKFTLLLNVEKRKWKM